METLCEQDIIATVRSLQRHQEAKILIDFSDACEISLEKLCILASIYTEAKECGIEPFFHNTPPYFHQVFPDIPEVDLSVTPYSDYQLVLNCRFNKFNYE